MLLIIEIAMFIGGIYTVIYEKLPSLLLGGGKYSVDGLIVRLIGILMLVPFPVAILSDAMIKQFFGGTGAGYDLILEILVILSVAILSTVLIRVLGQKIEPVNEIEEIISRKTVGALLYSVLSATGFAALVCCPLAFVYSNQALKLIDQNGVGQQYRRKANIARAFAGTVTLLWVVGIGCLVTYAVAAGN